MSVVFYRDPKKLWAQAVTRIASVSLIITLAACGGSSSGGGANPDITAPVITLYGNDTVSVQVDGNYIELSATANDNIDGTIAVTTIGSIDTATAGSYTVTYTATDAAGNVATETRAVNVVASVSDTTAPIITLNGNTIDTIATGETYSDLGATASDTIDGTLLVTSSGAVDTATAGRYTLVYTATDSAGNTGTNTRTINVLDSPDTTAPVVTLTGTSTMEVDEGSTFTDPGATATDNLDEHVTVTTLGSVNTSVIGSYTLNYSATDSSGNDSDIVTRTVSVVDVSTPDVTGPVITLSGDSNVYLFVGDTYNELGASAFDNRDGAVTVNITGDTVNTSETGIYTLIYTATDTSSNASSTTRTVSVGQVSQLNDTGVTVAGWIVSVDAGDSAGNNTDCSTGHTNESETLTEQDCSHGRDPAAGIGLTGFDFTKLDTNGDDLLASATDWTCVKDNHTDLIWEVKTAIGLHNTADRYNWYDTNTNTNGGDSGFENDDESICDGYTANVSTSYCNTQAFISRINTNNLCGASDWRLPTREELRSIVHYGATSPKINTTYFPQTASSFYWSSTSYAGTTDRFSWGIGFTGGSDDKYQRDEAYKVRLVRDAE